MKDKMNTHHHMCLFSNTTEMPNKNHWAPTSARIVIINVPCTEVEGFIMVKPCVGDFLEITKKSPIAMCWLFFGNHQEIPNNPAMCRWFSIYVSVWFNVGISIHSCHSTFRAHRHMMLWGRFSERIFRPNFPWHGTGTYLRTYLLTCFFFSPAVTHCENILYHD